MSKQGESEKITKAAADHVKASWVHLRNLCPNRDRQGWGACSNAGSLTDICELSSCPRLFGV